MKPLLSPSTRKALVLAEQGFTCREIGARVGVTRQAVEKALRRQGVRALTEKEAAVARLRALAAEGLTLTEAAKRVKRNRKHADKLAREHGIAFTGGNHRRLLRSLSAERRAVYDMAVRKRLPAVEALRIAEGTRP